VGTTPQQYNVPGRMASVAADQHEPGRAGAFVVFASERLEYDWHDIDQHKKLIADALAGMRWHVPRLLDSLHEAPELYFDSISRVSVPRWSSGRVALLGDAGFGLTLGGMGVGTSVVGAYVLAGELAAARGDHRTAFAAYERRLRSYAGRWQRASNPGQFLAPSTAMRLRLRNGMFRSSLVRRMLVASATSLATKFDLPDYAALTT
jgi:2-polyprenyl-6-methoxyphenol hydroxylase-like FAD-dependent oxidoreductase